MTPGIELPHTLVEALRRAPRPALQAWADGLPQTVAAVADRWQLRVGAPFQPGGAGSWVAPVRTAGGADRVLKVAYRHVESEHEADGLRCWDGRGTVRVHRADQDVTAAYLLLEHCAAGRALAHEPEQRQDEVVAGLLHRLWLEPPAGHPFRPLAQMCAGWVAGFHAYAEPAPFDPGLARVGVELFTRLPLDPVPQRLLLTDLHAANVLAADREPWLAIDPKPYVGDPAYDPVQHLLNCPDRLRADPEGLVLRLADLCGVDRERLRWWLFARCVLGWRSFDLSDVARALAP